jgi:WD40 repeat protein
VTAAFHPNGDRLASIGEENSLKIWRLADGKLLYSIEYSGLTDGNNLKSISYSPDGKTIAIATRDEVRFWSENRNAIRNLEFEGKAELNSISFSPNSQQIAIALGRKVEVFDLQGKVIDTFEDTEIASKVSFSPDGKTVIIAAQKKVKLLPFDGRKFGLERDALPIILENEDRVIDLAISPKGDNIVIASKDKAIVWKEVNKLALEDIVDRSCEWLQAYLKTNDKVEGSDRSLCH